MQQATRVSDLTIFSFDEEILEGGPTGDCMTPEDKQTQASASD
jgi:ABC-type phosphate transport system ATPase subunit